MSIIASAGTISTQDSKPLLKDIGMLINRSVLSKYMYIVKNASNVWLRFYALFFNQKKHFIACFIKESWTTLPIVTGLEFIKWDHAIVDPFIYFRIFQFFVILLLLP